MTKPLVSVIVPIFKTEAYVEKCLRSIMAQSLRDIEILCIDECSPDNAAAIVERLAEQDSRITLIRHKTNLGPGGARNTGIRAAKADYIASVDSDDYIDHDFLERLWDGAQDGYFDVVICGYKRVRPDGGVIDRSGHNKTLILDPIPADQNPIRISDPAFWNKLWRKSLFIDNDIWFPNHIYHQDSATTPRAYTKASRIRFIGGSPYNYLIRGNSITQSTSDKHLVDRFRCMDVLKAFFLKEGLYDRLHDAIEERTYSGYAFHVGNVVKNRHGGDAATDDYLRHLLIMRDGYLEHDMTVRSMSLEEKADYLINRKPLPRRAVPGRIAERQRPGASEPQVDERIPRSRLPDDPRVLVAIPDCGGHAVTSALAALKRQSYSGWKQAALRVTGDGHVPSSSLKETIDAAGPVDLTVLLPLDAILSSDIALETIIRAFRDDLMLDHLVLASTDYMTGMRHHDVHVLSDRATWAKEDVVAIEPIYPGVKRIDGLYHAPLATRRANPSSLQAYLFGAQQATRLLASVGLVEIRDDHPGWMALDGIWSQFLCNGDRRHALALVGAEATFRRGTQVDPDDIPDPCLMADFDANAQLSGAELAEIIRPLWDGTGARSAYLDRILRSGSISMTCPSERPSA